MSHFLPVIYSCRCLRKYYPINLPTASVIICFYNEEFHSLFRTVSSVMYLTPSHLLEEVVLVDDHSEYGKMDVGYLTCREGAALPRALDRFAQECSWWVRRQAPCGVPSLHTVDLKDLAAVLMGFHRVCVGAPASSLEITPG